MWAAVVVVASLLVGSIGRARAADEVDKGVPPYQRVSGISGNLNSVGSDTLNNLMQYWSEAFKKTYPNVTFQVRGEGSATAPPALTEGTAQLGPMSRKMKPEEEDAFEKKHGFKPTRLAVALDCVAVYVNKDNPVRGFTLPQVDCIFSSTRKSGFADIATWGRAGVEDAAWKNLPISLYGRNSISGTYAFFKKHALFGGDFKPTVKEQPGSAAVVRAVGKDRAGIGYSGIGYKTAEVPAAAAVGPRVPQVRSIQGGPADRHQGRLRAASPEGRPGGAQEARLNGAPRTPLALGEHDTAPEGRSPLARGVSPWTRRP